MFGKKSQDLKPRVQSYKVSPRDTIKKPWIELYIKGITILQFLCGDP